MLGLTEEHKIFKKTVADFVKNEIRPYVETWEEEGKTPRSLWKKCGELGFLGINYPEEYGGMNADYNFTVIFHQEMGKCDSCGTALGISVQTDMATPALVKHGNEFLKETYLKPAISGDMICSIAVSEPDHGSDVAAIETRARKEGADWIINGAKTFITNGTQADWITLLARTSDAPGYQGLSLFVVPTNIPGYSTGRVLKKTCYNSSDTAEIIFEDVRVSEDHLIGKEGMGFVYQMEQFQKERLAGCVLALGAMKRCYELTKRYITERKAFGKPLFKLQTISHKMAQMISEIKLIENSVFACAMKANAGIDFTKDVSMLKLITAQSQMRVMEECVQIHGGWGLMHEYPVARYFRDAKLTGIGGGTNEIMKEIIAKMEGLE
ncbi:MAG: acyl-CoA dehydrogenase [Bacteriovoracaceae bacterium]|jgi:citronellyl-CoA dehydrogenase|nr:acyl-CoA dehydrogenase [Bacteriovoracaceae bacterium]